MKKLVRVFMIAAIAAAATSSLIGCVQAAAIQDEFTITSTDAQFPLHVTGNDLMIGDFVKTYVSEQPACGIAAPYSASSVSVKSAELNPQLGFDRSSGVAAGTYYFQYRIEVEARFGLISTYENRSANVKLNLTETYPSPDGSPVCSAPYQAFINSASNSGGSVSVSWIVPDGLEFASEYIIRVFNQESSIQVGHITLGAPPTHDPQTTPVSISGAPKLLTIVLETVKGSDVVFTDTLKGVGGDAPGFIVVDDHAQLVQGSLERTTVDVLANDYEIPAETARNAWARLANASISIITSIGLNASVTGGQQVEVNAQGAEPGQYTVVIETTVPGADPQRQYLYVDYLAQGKVPPTLNDDSFTGFAGEAVPLPVLDNDSSAGGGPLTIASFTQPGGDATVTQVGQELQITGPVGEYNFSYTAADEFGNTASARVYVRLLKRPPTPQ
ncbi:MAG: Ig-like domain-containing protein [Nitrospinota bacterium]|nr:Ig-like domain-containing protein [Nitrospinota bacterium]